MALNKEVFKTRALSAIAFVIVMLSGLLWNHWSFLLLFTIIHFGCWHEYFKLLEKIYGYRFHRYIKTGMMLMGYGLMVAACGSTYTIGAYRLGDNLTLTVSAAGFLLAAIGIFQRDFHFRSGPLAGAALGWLYISLPWASMIGLFQLPGADNINGRGWLFPAVLMAGIWLNDTMAYIVGSLIGKTPFSKISPKKTWEGTIGGALLAVVMVTAIGHLGLGLSAETSAVIATIAAVIGTLGDLLESKLKRLAGVKDSGNMMPGHGGFLDRFDSMLLATPFVWLFVTLLT